MSKTIGATRWLNSLLLGVGILGLLFLGLAGYFAFPSVAPVFKCAALKRPQYPILSDKAEALFQEALQQSKASGPRDYTHIAKRYQQAVDLGHWKAMNNLAILYVAGLGVEENSNKALALVQQMQQYDIPEAYHAMASAHEQGLGRLSPSQEKAREYLAKAAEFADAESLYLSARAKMLEPSRESTLEAIEILQCSLAMKHGKSASVLALAYNIEDRHKDYYDTLITGANLNATSSLGDLESLFRLGLNGFPEDKKRAKCIQSYKSHFYAKGGESYQLPDDIRVLCPANVDLLYGITGG